LKRLEEPIAFTKYEKDCFLFSASSNPKKWERRL